MLSDEGLFVTKLIQPLDELHVALEAESRVFANPMERCHENSELHHLFLAVAVRASDRLTL